MGEAKSFCSLTYDRQGQGQSEMAFQAVEEMMAGFRGDGNHGGRMFQSEVLIHSGKMLSNGQ